MKENQKTIRLTLPFPPSLNNLYNTNRFGQRQLSIRGKAYKSEVLNLCFAFKVKPLSGDLKLNLTAFRPRKIGDLDNLLKAVQDSLKGSAFEDDKQIIEIHAFRFDDKLNPRVEIEIREIENSEVSLCDCGKYE